MGVARCLDSILSAHHGPSPFHRLIAFDIYDGPIEGLVFCRVGGEVFLYQLLAWDETQERRAFSLAPVAPNWATHVIDTLSAVETPRWPEWWFNASGSKVGHEKWLAVKAQYKREIGPVAYVAVSTDLLKVIDGVTALDGRVKTEAFQRMSARTRSDLEATNATFDQWLRFALEDVAPA